LDEFVRPGFLASKTCGRIIQSSTPLAHDLLITYPCKVMTMWPISTRVNKPENDDPSILDRVAEPMDWQAPLGLITNRGPTKDADERGTGTLGT
jgi:hypothetical protein